jgi:hypothetical protein
VYDKIGSIVAAQVGCFFLFDLYPEDLSGLDSIDGFRVVDHNVIDLTLVKFRDRKQCLSFFHGMQVVLHAIDGGRAARFMDVAGFFFLAVKRCYA